MKEITKAIYDETDGKLFSDNKELLIISLIIVMQIKTPAMSMNFCPGFTSGHFYF